MTAKKPVKRTSPNKATGPKLSVQEQLDLLAWEHEKFKHEVQVTFLQQALQNPQVQQALIAQILQQGGGL